MISQHITALLLLMSAVLLLGGGCASARRGVPVTQPFGAENASTQVRQGETVFYRACNACHVGGAAGLGPALNNKPLPGFLIRFQVRHGLGAMPAFSKMQLSDAKLDDLVVYLEALRQEEWPQAYLSAGGP